MLPYEEHRVLMGTYRNGLKIYNTTDGSVSDFESEADEFLIENGLYHGTHMADYGIGAYAFGTLGNGSVIIDRKGKILSQVTLEQGLQNSRVKFVYFDRQQNLWLALNNGISKVELNSPLKFYGCSI